MNKIAVIDLGSNSVRMSIFENKLPMKTLKAYRSTIRLSEGMTKDMKLKEAAQERAADALSEYKDIAEKNGADTVIAVATAAVRKAKNRQQFLDLIKEKTGIDIRVIDGDTEAALDSLAVSRTLDCPKGIICDIGGGSTELIGICENDLKMVSIPHGSRGICEMFFKNGEGAEDIAKAEAFAKGLLAEVDWLLEFSALPIVGIGGTLRAMAKFDLCDRQNSAIEKHEISVDRILNIIEEIKAADIDERRCMAGIGAERADIILGGVVLIEAIVKKLNPKCVIAADVGVREGVFYDFAENLNILK